jgi:DMSO reductase anchor subunit
MLLGFALPAVCAAAALAADSTWLWALTLLLQLPGIVADRWLFFAQAKHPQNLYYQVVS